MRHTLLGALTIQPEVIPINSKEGEGAKQVYPKSIVLLVFILL